MSLAPPPTRDAPATRPSRRLDHQFILLCLADGGEAMAIGMIFPLLARIQHAHHLPTYSLGIISGGAFIAALVGQVGVSQLLDGKWARPVLLAGVAAAVGALVWFALASNLWELAASRAINGVAYGVVGPAALRACTAGVPADQRGARIGRLSSVSMGGIVFGPLVGIGLAGIGGLRLPFLVLAGLLAAVLVGLVLTTAPVAAPVAAPVTAPVAAPATGPAALGAATTAASSAAVSVAPGNDQPAGLHSAASTPGPPGRVMPGGLRRQSRPPWRPIVALLLLSSAAQLPTGLYDALWSRLLTDRGAGSFLIGLSLTLFGIPIVFLAPFGGRLAARRGALRVAGAALVIGAAFMASYGFVRVPVAILCLGVVEACFQAVAIPGGFAAVADVFPDEWSATGQGWFSGAGTATAGVAALVGASAYAPFGPGAVFGGGAILSAALVGSAVLVGRGRYRQS